MNMFNALVLQMSPHQMHNGEPGTTTIAALRETDKSKKEKGACQEKLRSLEQELVTRSLHTAASTCGLARSPRPRA